LPSAKNIIIIGGVLLFVFAGGIGLSQTAFAQAKTDFTKVKGDISKNERVIDLVDRFKSRRDQNPTDKAGEMIV